MKRGVLIGALGNDGIGANAGHTRVFWCGSYPVTDDNLTGVDDLKDLGLPFLLVLDTPTTTIPGWQETGTYRFSLDGGSILINPAAEGIGTYVHCLIFNTYSLSGYVPFSPVAGTPGGIISTGGTIVNGQVALWAGIFGAPMQMGLDLNGWHWVTSPPAP